MRWVLVECEIGVNIVCTLLDGKDRSLPATSISRPLITTHRGSNFSTKTHLNNLLPLIKCRATFRPLSPLLLRPQPINMSAGPSTSLAQAIALIPTDQPAAISALHAILNTPSGELSKEKAAGGVMLFFLGFR